MQYRLPWPLPRFWIPVRKRRLFSRSCFACAYTGLCSLCFHVLFFSSSYSAFSTGLGISFQIPRMEVQFLMSRPLVLFCLALRRCKPSFLAFLSHACHACYRVVGYGNRDDRIFPFSFSLVSERLRYDVLVSRHFGSCFRRR